MPSSGMWSRVGLVKTEKRVAFNSLTRSPARVISFTLKMEATRSSEMSESPQLPAARNFSKAWLADEIKKQTSITGQFVNIPQPTC
jgi:hypothetical protein